MAQKYHIDSNGVPRPCTATVQPCRYGEHFDTLNEAQSFADKMNEQLSAPTNHTQEYSPQESQKENSQEIHEEESYKEKLVRELESSIASVRSTAPQREDFFIESEEEATLLNSINPFRKYNNEIIKYRKSVLDDVATSRLSHAEQQYIRKEYLLRLMQELMYEDKVLPSKHRSSDFFDARCALVRSSGEKKTHAMTAKPDEGIFLINDDSVLFVDAIYHVDEPPFNFYEVRDKYGKNISIDDINDFTLYRF